MDDQSRKNQLKSRQNTVKQEGIIVFRSFELKIYFPTGVVRPAGGMMRYIFRSKKFLKINNLFKE